MRGVSLHIKQQDDVEIGDRNEERREVERRVMKGKDQARLRANHLGTGWRRMKV